MRKRKEHDSRAIPLGILAAALGLLLLGGFSVFGVWQLANIPPTNTPLPSPIPSAFPTEPPLPYPTFTPPPTLPPPTPQPIALPGVGRIVYSTYEPQTIGFLDSGGAHDANIAGDNVALSPDGQTLAFTRNGKLYMRHAEDKQETQIAEQGIMPAWNGDGTALAYLVYNTDGTHAIYQLQLGKTQPVRLWVTQGPPAAPPQAVPGRKKLLIVELIAKDKTAFYTIDSTCLSFDACKNTREDIGTVPYTVVWADYHPSGTFIGFTEPEGEMYALMTANGMVKPLIHDAVYKTRFAFSPDGKAVVYINNSRMMIAPLDNPTAIEYMNPLLSTGRVDVESVDWAGK